MAHTERTVKWNEFLRIEDELGGKAAYPSAALFQKKELLLP